jgi:alpha-amylase
MSDLYNVNDNFGTRDDLKAFVKAAHAIDIWVMVDVVANHVGDVDVSFFHPPHTLPLLQARLWQ